MEGSFVTPAAMIKCPGPGTCSAYFTARTLHWIGQGNWMYTADQAQVRTRRRVPARNRLIRAALISDFGDWSCEVRSTSTGDRKSTRLNSSHLGISYAV